MDKIHPRITFSNGTSIPVMGLDNGTTTDANRARALEDATCAEDAVRAVKAALSQSQFVWTGRRWTQVYVGHVLTVDCEPFD